MMKNAPLSAYFFLHSAVFLFGFTGVLGQLISLQETMLVWHRLWMSALLMLFVVISAKKFVRISMTEFKPMAVAALFITLHWIAFYGSIKYANVSIAMVCLSTITLFTALLEPLMLRKPFQLSEVFLSLFVLLGVAVIAGALEGQITGIILGVIAAVLSAVFTILNKNLVSRYDSRLLSFYELGTGFLLLTILLPLIHFISPIERIIPNVDDWFYLFLLSLFCTVLAFNLSLKALRELSPFTVNLVINLEPVYGILLAFALFKEHKQLNSGFAIGALIIMFSVALHTLMKSGKLFKMAKYLNHKTP
jgi:drug/metabolite transporter (DMT)-like permease